jgi:excisionase family DNA binding protein
MGQLTDLARVAEYLGIVSQGRRPGNRVWELLKAGKLRGLPYLRIGRRYRFHMADVEAWVKRQMLAAGTNGQRLPLFR